MPPNIFSGQVADMIANLPALFVPNANVYRVNIPKNPKKGLHREIVGCGLVSTLTEAWLIASHFENMGAYVEIYNRALEVWQSVPLREEIYDGLQQLARLAQPDGN